jgi:hypothetical protein
MAFFQYPFNAGVNTSEAQIENFVTLSKLSDKNCFYIFKEF